jgi:gas vesicle protein
MNNRGFWMGICCGTLFGASAALLLAPKSGKELRNGVAESANRIGERARNTYQRASEGVTYVAGRAADIADDLADRAKRLTARAHESPTPSRPS